MRTRRMRRVSALVAGLVLWIGPRVASAQLATVETGSLRLVYFDGSETYLVPHAARTFFNSLAFQRKLFGFEPGEPITVLLADFADTGNAGASVVPRDALTIQIAPLSFAFETIAANDRLNTIMNHELVHVVTMDQAAGPDRVFRRLFFGKVNPVADQPESILYFYLTSPRVAAPRWYHEGIAVFVDTWMAGGLGRAQGGYDEMVFRAMVRDGATFYDPLGLASEGTKIDFQMQVNSYLYGTRFMTWLASRYSPEKLVEWVSRRTGSRGYYAAAFERTFGTSLQAAWREWVAWEHDFQEENLAEIRKYPVTESRDLSKRALGSVSRAFVDPAKRTLYAAFNYPGAVAHVGAIDLETGAVRHLVDIKGPTVYQVTSLAFDPEARTLYYTADNNAYRDIMSLDARTGRSRLVLKDARIGDLAFNRADRSLWGIRQLNGLCTLVRIPYPYREWNQVRTFPYGTVVYDLDVSPDGRYVSASFGEISGKQDVRVLSTEDVLAGRFEPVARFDFGASSVPNNFVFSPDGRFLYGSSYYTGASNIFRFELATKSLEAVSNAETGLVRPVPLGSDELVAFRYTGQGFVPTRFTARPLQDVSAITFLGERVVEQHPSLKSWMIGSPAAIPYDTMPHRDGRYRLAGALALESAFPVLQGYKDTAAAGYRVTFSDPLQLNRLSLAASYSPAGDIADSERVHLRADYQRYDWRARASWNDADFYDLFGPTLVGRKGYDLRLGHHNTLVFDEPRRVDLEIEGRYAGNLDRLPEYQNVAVDVTRMFTLYTRVYGSDVRSSLGHVDDEKGTKWELVGRVDQVNGKTIPKIRGGWDEGFALPIGHSSIWWRNAAGFSTADRADPFANFYFGAFGNNYVDRGDEQRYRSFYALPGFAINEIGGRTFVRSQLEWALPPLRFARAGTPGFYLTWARPSIFVTGLGTDLDSTEARHGYGSAGAQLDFRFTVLSTLDMTLSVGGALARDDAGATHREAMISLKVLK